MDKSRKYRPCVVAVFVNSVNQVLVLERSDHQGSWQLPQGGVEEGETPVDTLYREMQEELGCNKFKILRQAKELISYDFPKDMKAKIAKKYCGQEQTWFLVSFEEGAQPNLKISEGEFVNFKWVHPKEAIQQIVPWKKEAYTKGFSLLSVTN